ncbi:MAG: TonB-dependent receptor [Novosphingobium sp.]|nr:TonB-dependent receptor [Novosphingobium sp.]
MSKLHTRITLLTGAALMAGLAMPAVAQEAQAGAGEGEGIVVTGIRASLESAAAQKKAAASVIDAVTAEDIGKFPTENVADASQRITGVQITRTRGAGTGASIRGLPTEFTRVQLNGSTLSSASVDLRGGGAGGDISRSFDFRLLPTEFVSTLEVAKSLTADMQEGGLSGIINVKTVRPLDLGKTTLVGSAFAVRNSNAGKYSPRISGLASTTLLDGRLGVLIGGGYSRDRTETHNINNVGWSTTREATLGQDINNDGDRLDTFNIPSQIRTEIAREDRKRTVVTGIVEYEATDSLKLYAEGFYSRFDVTVESLENLNIFTGARGGVFNPATTQFLSISGIDPRQLAFNVPFVTGLGLTNTDVRANDRVNDSLAETFYGKLGADFSNDTWSGSINYAYSRSKQTGDNLNLAQIQRFQVTESCQPGQDICGLALSPESQARYLDPTQGVVASLNGAFGRKTRDEVQEFKANLGREFDDSLLRKVSIGGLASWRKTFADATTLVVPAAALAGLAGLPAKTGGFGIGAFNQVVTASKGTFLGAYDGNQPFPTSWLATDTQALLAAVDRAKLAAVPGAVQANLSSVVDVRERIFAGYVQADFASSDDRFTGNVGLRVVNTREIANGVSPNLNGLIIQVETGGTVTVPPAGAIAARNSYTNWLPALNLKFQPNSNWVFRAAVSRTMSRPSLTQISPSTTVTGGGGNYTITSGNPDLKPFTSTNYDLTAEWYPNRDTTLTVALFAKKLSTLVRPTQDTVTLRPTFFTASTNTSEARDQVFQRTRPTNERGVTLKGFEVGFQQVFTFLPGPLGNTGLQANYTYISNSDPQVLTAASKNNYNISGFYEDKLLALRASYTWRDKFVSLGLPGGYNGLGVTTQARGNLDVNLTVNVTEQISLIAEGTNVLDNVDKTRSTLGDLPVDFFDVGRQILVGARFRF